MIETKQLVVLAQIAQQQSVSKAAKALNLSQPAISHILAKLEDQTGGSLFDRSHKQMQLTQLGQHCLNHAQPILRQLNTLQNSLQKQTQQQLRVRSNCLHSQRWLPQVISQYRQLMPDVNLQISNQDEGIQPLFNGSADIVINSHPHVETGIASQTIASAEIVLIFAHENSPTSAPYVDPTALTDIDFVYYQGLNQQSLDQIVDLAQVDFKSYTILDSMDTILELVASGYGVSAVPTFVVEQSPIGERLTCKSINPNKSYKTWRAHYLKKPASNKIETFVNLLTARESSCLPLKSERLPT